jgi:hypothetical protein
MVLAHDQAGSHFYLIFRALTGMSLGKSLHRCELWIREGSCRLLDFGERLIEHCFETICPRSGLVVESGLDELCA